MLMMLRTRMGVWLALVMMGVWTTQTHTQAGSCRDQLYGCPEWARRGLCDYDLKFMYEKCSASCNVCLDKCEDRLPDCQERVARGMCKTKLHLMYRQCSYSCNVCVGNCWNYSPECPLWAERNLCETDPLFMHQKCPVSCKKVVDADCVDKSNNSIVELPPLPSNDKNINNLSLLPIKQRSIVHPDFECGRPIQTLTATTTTNRRHRNTDMMEVIISGQKARLRRASIDQDSEMVIPGDFNTTAPLNGEELGVEDIICGASPISDRYIVTAAHCVYRFSFESVRLGELDFGSENENNSMPVDYEIEEIIVHPGYEPDSHIQYNDVALLKTVDKIIFNDLVFPYCVSDQTPAPNTIVTGSGFGLANATHQSSMLQEAELRILDSAECENIYRREHHEPQLRVVYPDLLQGRDIMCANHPERSACEGDSGGPLFLDVADGRRFLVGMVGSGVACRGGGASILPDLFVNLAHHITFIDKEIFGNIN